MLKLILQPQLILSKNLPMHISIDNGAGKLPTDIFVSKLNKITR